MFANTDAVMVTATVTVTVRVRVIVRPTAYTYAHDMVTNNRDRYSHDYA